MAAAPDGIALLTEKGFASLNEKIATFFHQSGDSA